ncbi:MAG: LUD domain-containing protein [Bacteroidales bacterium]|jgi:L-lactate dehydrogenase complex protein LldG|nr:LUD domain-containing protein [Bacteroidales bacterium]
MSARENILNRLKAAASAAPLATPDFSADIYATPIADKFETFKANLEPLGGRVFLTATSETAAQLVGQLSRNESWGTTVCLDPKLRQLLSAHVALSNDLDDPHVGITPCEFLVAHTGSVMISSAGASGRRLHVFPEIHVVIAAKEQTVAYLDDAIKNMRQKYGDNLPSLISNITGPSRTADIEKTLVKGMHGPRSIIVIVYEHDGSL